MRSTFGALNTAALGLLSQQVAIDTTSHNIANANTPGFSRQAVLFETTIPHTLPALHGSSTIGQIGTGVSVAAIRRLRDAYLDTQIRVQQSEMGKQEISRETLEQIEVVFNEPSDQGLNTMISRFFSAWQAVVNRPEDRPARTSLVVESQNLVAMVRRNDTQLTHVRADINHQIELRVGEVNTLATRIATLNVQIGQVRAAGQQPNDLMDQRDALVTELSKITHVSVAENQNGSINLFLNSRALVLDNEPIALTTGFNGAGDTTVLWAGDLSPANPTTGAIGGLIAVRDGALARQRDGLHELAAGLISTINAVHMTGYGMNDLVLPGRAFFSGTNATTIAIDNSIIADPTNIAAADGPSQPGNNRVAIVIAGLRDAQTMSGNTTTFHAFFQSLTAELGAEARRAGAGTENQRVLVQMLERRQESVAGVSLDDEATNLIRFQHAYRAAARAVTAVDEMLDQIINRMGRVGL